MDSISPITPQTQIPPQHNSSLILTTVTITILILVLGTGLFYLGYRTGSSSQPVSKPSVKDLSLKNPSGEVPYGDEDFENDPEYKQAMEFDASTGLFTSYFGYALTLPAGWQTVPNLTFSDAYSQKEAFSPLTADEIISQQMKGPYNPNYYLEVEVRDNPDNVSLTEWTTNSNYTPQGLNQQVLSTKVGIYDAVKVTGNQGDGFVDYYIACCGKVYNLSYYYSGEGEWQSPATLTPEMFEEIISTFTLPQ